ncbi:MAG: hypothetical protein FGM41_06285 [Bacteroidetes bacterium]|nr:hypothetical protein [Bacteroidota bacterium]
MRKFKPAMDSICENATEFYSTSSNLNSVYNWQGTGGAINSGQATNSIAVTWSAAGQGTVTLLDSNTSSNCSGQGSRQITKIAFPEPISILGKKDGFDLSTHGYSVQLEGGITYFWKGTNGNIISGQGSDEIRSQPKVLYSPSFISPMTYQRLALSAYLRSIRRPLF